MADIGSLNGIIYSSLGSVNYVTAANIAAINGVNLGLAMGAYTIGGDTGTVIANSIEKLTFSTGTWAALAATAQTARDNAMGTACWTTAGYMSGGRTNLTFADTNSIEKIVFATETTSSIAGTLQSVRWYQVGMADGATYGYWTGGVTGSSTPYTNVTDKITFSTETVAAATTANISPARRYHSPLSSPATGAGYAAGGSTNAYVNSVDKITYSTAARAANAYNLSQVGGFKLPMSSGGTYGYWCGGLTGSGGTLTTQTDRHTFSTDVIANNASAVLVVAKRIAQGASDGATYGYMSGGYSTAFVSTSDKMTFSAGTFAADTASQLLVARHSYSLYNSNAL